MSAVAPFRSPSPPRCRWRSVATLLTVAVLAACQAATTTTPQPAPATASPRSTTSPVPTITSSPAATSLPSLDGTFTSDIVGISTAYPSGWKVIEAVASWTTGLPRECESQCSDHIYEKEADSAFLNLASQARGGQTGEAWAAAIIDQPGWDSTCPPETEPMTIDGSPALLVAHCPHGLLTALSWTEDRGYLIVLYRIDDRAWFRQILATVRLDPQDAIDVP